MTWLLLNCVKVRFGVGATGILLANLRIMVLRFWHITGLFYRKFRWFTIAVSWGSWLVFQSPMGEKLFVFLNAFLWIKLFSNAVVWYLTLAFNRRSFLFYQNLGFAIWQLFIAAFVWDLFVFVVGLTFLQLLRWVF